jgi:hypothetical protein
MILSPFRTAAPEGGPKDAAPAQFYVLQRFASSVNLHLHDHAVVSDGVFSLDKGVLRFESAPPQTFAAAGCSVPSSVAPASS